jgi:TonB-like protein
MKSFLFLLYVVAVALPCTSIEGTAQVAKESRVEEGKVALSQLSPPMFPPLARQARISGEVKVQLSIRTDGSVESASAVSGDPMLVPAALESARGSLFKCSRCTELNTPYELIYRFQVVGELERCCCSAGARAIRESEVSYSDNHVTITASPACVCPDPCAVEGAIAQSRRRSAKCLYLWKCGVRPFSVQ